MPNPTIDTTQLELTTLVVTGETHAGRYGSADALCGARLVGQIKPGKELTCRECREVSGTCRCGSPLSGHIENKPCVYGKPREVRSSFDLPIARWAWEGDAAQVER